MDTDETLPVTADSKVIMLDITPEFSATARFMAFQFAEHGFDNRSYGPMASLIEQIAFLTKTEPETVKKLIEDLEFRAKKVNPSLVLSTLCSECGNRELHDEDCRFNIGARI